MIARIAPGEPYLLEDGLGVRRLEQDDSGEIDILELKPELSSYRGMESAICDRASLFAALDIRSFARVRTIERAGTSLRVTSEISAGVRLSRLLESLDASGDTLPDAAVAELAWRVINAVASLHAWPGGLSHGAISTAHVLLTDDGRVMLTDCVFGSGIELLQRNREVLWKDFGLALAASAGQARFDQQADVTEMGAVILAIVLQRPIRADEYPRGVSDLVVGATEAPSVRGIPGSAADLRRWLLATLQTHPRLAFRSAVEAQRSFVHITNHGAGHRRTGTSALQAALKTMIAASADRAPGSLSKPVNSARDSVPAAPGQTSPFDSILRAVFTKR